MNTGMRVVCSLKSACGLGSDKISNSDELQDLSPEEMVDVFNAIYYEYMS